MPLDFSTVAPVYDLLNDAISLGLHRRWKRTLVKELRHELTHELHGEGKLADIAAGTGDVAALLQASGKNSVVAVEPCASMLVRGQQKTNKAITWVGASSETLPLADQSLAGITCSFGVRNFTDRPQAFREWKRVLEPGGVCAILEIHPPRRGLLKFLLNLHWKVTMPLLGRLFGRTTEYRYLRDSVMGFVSPEGLAQEAVAAGLSPVRAISLFGKGMVSLSLFRNHG